MLFLLLVTLASSPLVFAVDDSPKFAIQPRNTTAIRGATVTLYCSVNGLHLSSSQFVWVKDGAVITRGFTILTADHDRFTISATEEGNYHLIITASQSGDSGAYRCLATTGGTGLISDIANLQIFSSPAVEYPVCGGVGSNEVAVGETVTLACNVDGGNPKAEIFFNKGDVAVQTLETETGITYEWTVAEEDDAAEFICIATQRFWADPRTCRLGPFHLVRGVPTLNLVPAETTVQFGQSVSFLCSAESAPRAVYKWYIGGEEVLENVAGKRTIQVIGESSILLIHDVGNVDESLQIVCVVNAATGTVSSEALMHVQPIYVIVTDAPGTKPPGTDKSSVDTENPDVPSREAPTPTGRDIDEPATSQSAIGIPLIVGCSAGAVVLALIVAIVIASVRMRSSGGSTITKSTEKLAEGAVADSDDYYFRSRHVGIARSWLFPIHKDTQKAMTASMASTPSPS